MRKTSLTTVLLLIWALLVPVQPAQAMAVPCPNPVAVGTGSVVGYGCTDLSKASQQARITLRVWNTRPPDENVYLADLRKANATEETLAQARDIMAKLIRAGSGNSTLSVARQKGTERLVLGFSNSDDHAEPRITEQMAGDALGIVWDPVAQTVVFQPAAAFEIEKINVDIEPCTENQFNCQKNLAEHGVTPEMIEFSWLWNLQHWDRIYAQVSAAMKQDEIAAKLGTLSDSDRKNLIHAIANTGPKSLKYQALQKLRAKTKGGPAPAPRYIPDGSISAAIPNAVGEALKRRPKPPEEGEGGVKPGGKGPTDTGPAGGAADPGGIDFASVELRYVSSAGGGSYAFGAPITPGRASTDGVAPILDSLTAVQVWLTVEPSKFWVNLNPNEPDRVIDPILGATDAGRVLLEADLKLKEAGTKLVDPNAKLGKKFWKRLSAAHVESFCTRNWIVPGTATVRESGDELYVLDAPLKVESEGDYFSLPGSKQEICPADSSTGAAVYKSLIVPALADLVNTAPEFRPLRQVYHARVVAEWYRQRARATGDADDLGIDSNDVTTLETIEDWAPRTVFDKYVKEINATTYRAADEFTVTTGGVDFSQPVTWAVLDDTAFGARYPELPAVVRSAVTGVARSGDGKTAYVGGSLAPQPTADPQVSADPVAVGSDLFAAPNGLTDRHPVRSTLLVLGVVLLILVLRWRIRAANRQMSRSRRTG